MESRASLRSTRATARDRSSPLTGRILSDTPVFEIRQTEAFEKWLRDLRDMRAKARILVRIDSARLGNLGDTRSVGDRVSEMRIDVGPGYRVYFTRRQRIVIVLLCGGDKSTQAKDIERARRMAQSIE